MYIPLSIALFLVSLVLSTHSHAQEAQYEAKISQANQWLISQQNVDGSWGTLPTEKYISTVETVKAFRTAGIRNEAYYQGIAWLQNHSPQNIDYRARRAVAFRIHGAGVTDEWINVLGASQNATSIGRNGWGLSSHYMESPLDTALVLDGLYYTGETNLDATVSVNSASAINYLKSVKRSDGGWAIGVQNNSDPFSTAIVVKGLAARQAPSSPEIIGGMGYLQNVINSNSTNVLKSMAVHAAILAGNSSANTWLSSLITQQNSNGSWSNRVYDTALAMQVFALADGLNNSENQTTVSVSDANLRKAINTALGRGALDNLERGDLAKLTTLTASNLLISDLTGLEAAINLTTLDLRNNNITSTAPIDNLAKLSNLLLDGNPVAGGSPDPDPDPDGQDKRPVFPIWMFILFDM